MTIGSLSTTRVSRAAIAIVTFVAGAFATGTLVHLLLRLYAFIQTGGSPTAVIAWELLRILVPATGGWVTARAVMKRSDVESVGPQHTWRRALTVTISVVLLAGYFVTWAFGVPAVLSSLAASDIESYKQASREHWRMPTDRYPYTATFVALPVLPCVIVSYHEMQVAGLWGWGAFVWSFWYPGHTAEFSRQVRWIS